MSSVIHRNEQLSSDELAADFVDSLLQERVFDRAKLISKTKAYINAFVGLKDRPSYNKIQSPSKDAKRLRTIEQKDIEVKYWKDLCCQLDEKNMDKHYKQLEARLVSKGFKDV